MVHGGLRLRCGGDRLTRYHMQRLGALGQGLTLTECGMKEIAPGHFRVK